MLAMLAFPSFASAQDNQPPGLPAVDFGDEEVPEFETEDTNDDEQNNNDDDDIGSPPSLEIDTGNPNPPIIEIDPNPPVPPEPVDPGPMDPIPNPELPDTGSPALLLSLIPALGYSVTRKLNK